MVSAQEERGASLVALGLWHGAAQAALTLNPNPNPSPNRNRNPNPNPNPKPNPNPDEAREAARAALTEGSQALARREAEVAALRGMLLMADADVAALGEFPARTLTRARARTRTRTLARTLTLTLSLTLRLPLSLPPTLTQASSTGTRRC